MPSSPQSELGVPPTSRRLPDATHIGRVTLQVSDLGRSVEYYERVVGLRTLSAPGDTTPSSDTASSSDTTPSGDTAVLAAHESGVPLVQLRERRGVRPVPRSGLLGLYHFAILLPDRAALGRQIRHLADLGIRAGMSDHLVSEAIYLQDPDNLGIEMYVDRPRASWRVENGQLVMSTLPLDVAAVVESAGTTRWSGAPAGTTIGHVHLHVGDIAAADAFYHTGLGLDRMVWSYPGALFLSAGGYHHHLGLNTWARGAPSASEDDARLLEWELVVPAASDVGAIAAGLKAGTRDGESLVVSDPWKTPLRVRARESRAVDRNGIPSPA